MPVILATQEAEAGELPEPRQQMLREPDHATALQLGQQSDIQSQKKKKERN